MDMWNINQSDKLFPIKPNIHYFILSLPIQPTQPLFSPLHSPFLSNPPNPYSLLSYPPNPIISYTFSLPIQPTQPLFSPILYNQPYSLLDLLPFYPTHPTLFSPAPSPFLSNPPNPYSLLSYPINLILSYTFSLPI